MITILLICIITYNYKLCTLLNYIIPQQPHDGISSDHNPSRGCPVLPFTSVSMIAAMTLPLSAVQEYDFSIVYRKGVSNGCFIAKKGYCTSHCSLSLFIQVWQLRMSAERCYDKKLRNALEISQCPQNRSGESNAIRRFLLLWSQLVIHDGIVCRKYRPAPTCEPIMVPILPQYLYAHSGIEGPSAGHLGAQTTLDRVW